MSVTPVTGILFHRDMAFVDELTIKVKAGDGGDGVVRWRHEKYREFAGPSGGNGGRGGDVYARAIRNTLQLGKYTNEQHFEAERGIDGGKDSLFGRNGKDLEVLLPIGSYLRDQTTGEEYELLEEGQRTLLAKGGKGGLGNEHFKSSRNPSPKECTPGRRGEQAIYQVELRLFADAGFIGFPNAGKTSLLNALTNAGSKVGDYEFTTLDPNLGAFHGHVLADIPGLIEGAADGKGLGHKFLRHITRTKILVHCISLERKDLKQAYLAIRDELGSFDARLLDKPEIIILTKSDVQAEDEVDERKKQLERDLNRQAHVVSILDDTSLKELTKILSNALKEG